MSHNDVGDVARKEGIKEKRERETNSLVRQLRKLAKLVRVS